MKNFIYLLSLLLTFNMFSQEIAVTESGKRVFLKSDGTYEFLKDSKETGSKSKVRGVVTYFFNNNYGNKPDIGSEVIIRKITESDSTYLLLYDFQIAKNYRKIVSNSKITGSKDEYAENKIKELGVDTDEKYEEFCKTVYKYITQHRLINKEAHKLTVDANGSFEIMLEDGKYEIIVISKNRTSLNPVEVLGQVSNKIITVKNGETTNITIEFKV